ncbi:MAG: MFS transporter [Actinobacteria bacterium]|nr:MFS transporter [Actinomycetota bacterium]
MPTVALSTPVRRLMAATMANCLGTGFVLPIVLIYLHRVRGIPLSTTGLLMAIPGVIGLIVVPLSGALSDRFGARQVLVVAQLVLSAAEICMIFVHTAGWAAAALVLRGAAMGPTFPAFNTLLGSLSEGRAQQRAFAINFTIVNAAIGVGGVVGGVILDAHHPWTFQIMFLGDAIGTALASAIVLSIRNSKPAVHDESEGARPASYRQVLARPSLRRLVFITLLLALCGYAALDSGLPAYANVVAGVSPQVVAWSLSANTLVIVVCQLVVLRLLRGRRRTLAIVIVGLVWCGSWLLFGLSAVPDSHTLREVIVIAFSAIFGFGECFMSPSVAPLVNTLAADEVRGRANALTGGVYSLAFVVSPAISAAFISAGIGGVWIGLLAAGCLVVSALALRLRRRLRPEHDVATETHLDDDIATLESGAIANR